MNNTSILHKRGFYVSTNRESKAQKIKKIINECTQYSLKNALLLDIGTGNGEISHFLSESFDVISVDIEDHRNSKEGYQFLITNESLPFPDDCFDVVVSNHVVEHVSDQKLHFSEMARVLKPNGIVYFATPNRLWPWEVHYQLPLIHYLPNTFFIALLKRWGKFKENVNLLTWFDIKKSVKSDFKIQVYSDKVCRLPDHYFMSCSRWCRIILSFIPLKIYTLLTFIHPTFIFILQNQK